MFLLELNEKPFLISLVRIEATATFHYKNFKNLQ